MGPKTMPCAVAAAALQRVPMPTERAVLIPRRATMSFTGQGTARRPLPPTSQIIDCR